jgi:oligopeptide/dipeptide ABC transporter ATP-binding protein
VVPNTQNALLDVRGLTVELPTAAGWIRPVHDVSLSLAASETLALVGESGSGKTMLALALMGLLPPGARVSGEAQFASYGARANLAALTGEEMRRLRGREMAMIFQEPMTALNPVMRVGAQIEEAVRVHQPGLARDEAQRRVVQALTRAAVPEPESCARQFPHQLSGGLRQRAMIAMALASGATEQRNGGLRLLIADEPTTALDVTVQKQILELLACLQAELGMALLFITHDLGVAAQIAQRIAVMYAGRIVEEGPAEQVLRAPLHPYTGGLLRAAPRLSSRTLEPIPGAVPQLHALPPGCAFEPRCPVRLDGCLRAVPEMRPADAEHRARCILITE